jgi:hypothetical protein
MRRLFIPLVTLGLLLLAVAPIAAAPPTPDNPAGHGKALGVVPARNQAGHRPGSANNLSYHGGPVMHTNTVYAIYWAPGGTFAGSTTYQTVINGFFANVARASGSTSNVYYSDTQYTDTTGSSTDRSTFAGAVVDKDAFPANGCSDSATSICLTDAQISAEIDAVVTAQHLPRGASTLYFLFTPKGVGSCFDAADCAFTQYCAYHSWFTSAATGAPTLYANMPYADTVPAACDAGQHPNNDDADATLNVTSHEHNEGITDEQGSAWFDNQGFEDGDKCAWTFGTALGSTGSGQYNQVIGTGKYYLQQEWSNNAKGCVLTGK